jgi:predicted permease
VKDLFPIFFGVLFASVFLWFALCHRLFKAPETRHPEKYSAMGKPGLIMNNSLSNNISFMKFLCKRECLDLNDFAIAKLAQFMLVFLVVYLIGFSFLFYRLLLGYAP